ncbi:DUF5655 domain-containing protein [Peterkaempfera bronchialis]|uniref:DUF5655 domain-containing protein n=1 Tax=Peterkaempfera bronchialis TaxID=2126346 RepID=UPI003C2FDC9D
MGLERHLQRLIEANMPEMLGLKFLASEYATGPLHRGRIDTLALDEDGTPVIVEYKRTGSASVLSQGLFYLAWLVEHRAEFESLVVERLGEDVGRAVDWSNPRVVCVATEFTRYDTVAVGMSHHRIDLLVYRQYAQDLVTLELVASVAGGCGTGSTRAGSTSRTEGTGRRGLRQSLDSASPDLRGLFSELEERLLDLGDGTCVELQHYWAFRRRRNFACVRVTRDALVAVLHVDPSTVHLAPGFTRDLRGVGHLGTGDLEVRISSAAELDRAEPLFAASFAAAA